MMARANWSERKEALKAPWRNKDARRCLAFELFWSMFFGTAVMQTYYESLGLGQDKVNQLQSWLALTTVVAGVPGGWLADRFGVRRMMIIGATVQAIQSVYFANCQTFGEFIISLTLSGISWALLSGATSSLMMSTLEKSPYRTYESWAVQMRCAGLVIAIVAGYFMVQYGSLQLPYQCQPIAYALGVVVALRLRKRFVGKKDRLSAGVMVSTAHEMLWRQPAVRYATVFFAAVHAGLWLVFWLIQPRLREGGVKITDLGLLYLVMSVSTSVFSFVADLWLRSIRTGKLLLLIVPCVGIAVSGLVQGAYGAVALLLAYSFANALYIQVQRATFRELLPEEGRRTTELAVASAFASLYFALLSWAFGELAVAASLNITLLSIAAATLFIGGGSLWAYHRSRRR